jgi:hypothetical protein
MAFAGSLDAPTARIIFLSTIDSLALTGGAVSSAGIAQLYECPDWHSQRRQWNELGAS